MPGVVKGVEVKAEAEASGVSARVLTAGALEFVAGLERTFGERRRALLGRRREVQKSIDAGATPRFLPETARVRAGDWKVAPSPPDLRDRRVEITGPVDRKMLINALNSGAKVFMADFEDSNTPTWNNLIEGQANLIDAIERTISLETPEGRRYKLNDAVATLFVRPRGWHLDEKHVLVDGRPMSGSLFDFGLYFFHNARRLLAKGAGPYFYLPKIESHLEARLWNDVFVHAQERIGVPRGSIKATVLIETILAAFEMDEILFELRDHSAGLNAGRWDYLFSIIKKFHTRRGFNLPDRAQLTMTVPFMRAYTELLVRTCHRRGAHAMGGMAAFIPSRRDAAVNETALARVREDKRRESADGFDGTWVAHPDLVTIAMEVFDGVLGSRPNQIGKTRTDVAVTEKALLDFSVPGGTITEAGLRDNVDVGIRYLESWLRGVGAAAINNLMEDAATAEIARSLVWLWLHHAQALRDGRTITQPLVRQIIDEETAKHRVALGASFDEKTFSSAVEIFTDLVEHDEYDEFLTLKTYAHID